jgi:hypothetical protein
MNKRQTKKANQKRLHNFIHNINIEHKDLREDFYYLAFYEHCREDDDDDMTVIISCKISNSSLNTSRYIHVS